MDINELRRLLASGEMAPEDMQAAGVPNELARMLMPMPTAPNVPPMQQNTMRVESGPDAGKVTSLDFTNRMPPQTGQNQANVIPSQGGMTQNNPQERRTMQVIGMGNGTQTNLQPEFAPPQVNIDRSRAPVDIMGAKGYYSKDEPGVAYVMGPDGQPAKKVILGYDMHGSMALNKYNLDQQKTRQDMAHTAALTAEVGSPNYQLTPNGDVFNPKTGQIAGASAQPGVLDRQKQKAAYDMGLKEIQADQKQVEGGADIENALKRWGELQGRVSTGRLMGHMPAIGDPDRQELERLSSFLSMNNFKPGQGSMSNMERSLIKGGGPNVLNDPETNLDAVRIMLGGVQNMRERDFFKQTYLQAKGNLLGADQAWQQYVDANPRYVQDAKTGRLGENLNRADWQTFFKGWQLQQSAQPQQQAGPRPQPNAQAVQAAKNNPALRADFVRTFGQEAAARYGIN